MDIQKLRHVSPDSEEWDGLMADNYNLENLIYGCLVYPSDTDEEMDEICDDISDLLTEKFPQNEMLEVTYHSIVNVEDGSMHYLFLYSLTVYNVLNLSEEFEINLNNEGNI